MRPTCPEACCNIHLAVRPPGRVGETLQALRGSLKTAAAKTKLQWFDYSGKLPPQRPSQRHLVLYNAAGTNVSATYCDREGLASPFVVDHKLYWTACEAAEEAHYLVAIFNFASVNLAIKPFQSTGLLGERYIHKSCWKCPLPG